MVALRVPTTGLDTNNRIVDARHVQSEQSPAGVFGVQYELHAGELAHPEIPQGVHRGGVGGLAEQPAVPILGPAHVADRQAEHIATAARASDAPQV